MMNIQGMRKFYTEIHRDDPIQLTATLARGIFTVSFVGLLIDQFPTRTANELIMELKHISIEDQMGRIEAAIKYRYELSSTYLKDHLHNQGKDKAMIAVDWGGT